MDQQSDQPLVIPKNWVEAIELGERDLAEGRTVSADIVLSQLRAGLKALEASSGQD